MKNLRNVIKLSLGTVFCFATLAQGASTPNDAQIAKIVMTANAVDIDAGELAEKMSANKEVKDLARRMIADHRAVNKQATDLVKKLKVTPQDSDVSKSLKDGGDKNIASLKLAKGPAFDKSYVNHEVMYHQAVLDTIDSTLIPNAKNAELKGLITKVRPAIAAHLDHAKVIQSKLFLSK